jgi:5-methylcytosine-specific restriction endonuclease McrA
MAYRDYTDNDIINAAKEVKSLAGLIRALGKVPAGGNFDNMKRHLQRLNVDTSHWTGQGWNAGERLKDYKDYTRSRHVKIHLIKERGHRCECCNLSEWLTEPIMIELHHIDGNRTNNDPSNLQLLCPNCHATTDNWRNRKR